MLNQVFLGNSDPLLTSTDITEQLQRVKNYEAQLMRLQQTTVPKSFIWDSIDQEMNTLTDSQKERFLQDKEYVELSNEIQRLVQIELLNLVKGKIEKSSADLLQKQLDVVKRLKTKIVQETDNDIAIFNKFREYSKDDPNLTYEEFCKKWRNM